MTGQSDGINKINRIQDREENQNRPLLAGTMQSESGSATVSVAAIGVPPMALARKSYQLFGG